jgi:hypothetical protein
LDIQSNSKSFLLFLFFIFFVTLSGILRKWIFGPGNVSDFLFFIQILFPFYIFLISRQNRPFFNFDFFYVFLLFLVLSIFNVRNKTIFHGLIGFFLHSSIFFLWVSYLLNISSYNFEKYIFLFFILVCFEFSLSSIQYFLPSSHILNKYASGEDSFANVGDFVRVSGSFSFISGFQAFVVFISFLIFYLILTNSKNFYIYSSILFGFIMAFMSGSRTAVFVFSIILFFSLFYFKSISNIFGRIFIFSFFTIFIIFYFPSLFEVLTVSFDNFFFRLTSSDDSVGSRLEVSILEVLNFRGDYPIFGIGLGSTYQGANKIFGISPYLSSYVGGFEEELERIVLEGGYVFLFIRFFLIFALLKRTLYIPLYLKLFIFSLFLFLSVTFSIYQGFFLIFGIILLDRGFLIYKS